jgi:hypothetical protein
MQSNVANERAQKEKRKKQLKKDKYICIIYHISFVRFGLGAIITVIH